MSVMFLWFEVCPPHQTTKKVQEGMDICCSHAFCPRGQKKGKERTQCGVKEQGMERKQPLTPVSEGWQKYMSSLLVSITSLYMLEPSPSIRPLYLYLFILHPLYSVTIVPCADVQSSQI